MGSNLLLETPLAKVQTGSAPVGDICSKCSGALSSAGN